MGLRFLNYHDHVHSSQGFNFTDDFNSIKFNYNSENNNINKVTKKIYNNFDRSKNT